jgi:hypothetical protein
VRWLENRTQPGTGAAGADPRVQRVQRVQRSPETGEARADRLARRLIR